MGLLSVITRKGKQINDIREKIENTKRLTKLISEETGMTQSSVLTALGIYSRIFSRCDRPNYKRYPGMYEIGRFNGGLERKTIKINSDGYKLTGYRYDSIDPKGLIVFVHGLKSGADDYLPLIEYFFKKGYSVLAFDSKGVFESEGESTYGFQEQLVDLDNVLNFVKKDKTLSSLKVYLVGHSCGAFATCAILNFRHDINAILAIAPVNDPYNLFVDKGYQYAGDMARNSATLSKTFLDSYQNKIFGKYASVTGVSGINNTDIPILIAHGLDDKTISVGEQSILCHKNEITNPNVEYYIGSGCQGGHDSIWHSDASFEYMKKIHDLFKEFQKKDKMSDEQIDSFYSAVDNRLYSDINKELFDKAIRMFEGAK